MVMSITRTSSIHKIAFLKEICGGLGVLGVADLGCDLLASLVFLVRFRVYVLGYAIVLVDSLSLCIMGLSCLEPSSTTMIHSLNC